MREITSTGDNLKGDNLKGDNLIEEVQTETLRNVGKQIVDLWKEEIQTGE